MDSAILGRCCWFGSEWTYPWKSLTITPMSICLVAAHKTIRTGNLRDTPIGWCKNHILMNKIIKMYYIFNSLVWTLKSHALIVGKYCKYYLSVHIFASRTTNVCKIFVFGFFLWPRVVVRECVCATMMYSLKKELVESLNNL